MPFLMNISMRFDRKKLLTMCLICFVRGEKEHMHEINLDFVFLTIVLVYIVQSLLYLVRLVLWSDND